ncbi:predicted protein [Naegleria gruberi]|uniref:Predicted protein n=1 Tax=Naegleria gruberi TaxID=5762 RepID=D2W3J6_NAEGR|nr:uncharacterized protein NAEGRDRAFT_75964 [Naegleria gruberi]EFC36345.1 predicted protein [Naegleria gruberi]|eukprot:XP_002669089.1 predicted protein [Naegleria gruberi strain NEG-M]
MKLSIVNFQSSSQQDRKLVMTLQTEAQSYKCYGQSTAQPNYFYWNQNATTPQISNKIKKSRKMSPTTTNCCQTNLLQHPSNNNQIVYELSPMTNSLFNVSKRRRKQSLHSHEKVFSVNDNTSCSSSSSGSIQSRSASPKLKKQNKMSNANNSPRQEFIQSYSNPTQFIPPTQQVSTPMTVNTTMTCIPTTCQQEFVSPTSFVQTTPKVSSPRIVRSSISIRELLN